MNIKNLNSVVNTLREENRELKFDKKIIIKKMIIIIIINLWKKNIIN